MFRLGKNKELDSVDTIFLDKNEELGNESFHIVSVNSKNELGYGAYGKVYSGVLDKQAVAIKIIDLDLILPGKLDSINQEARIHASLKHDNIVKLLGTSRSMNSLFLVLELMEYGSLFDILYEHKIPLNTSECVTITADLVNGLAYLHKRNVLHRDIKPGNILFNRHMQAKLADFGFAIKVEDASTSRFTGSKSYTAPELALVVLDKSRCYEYSLSTDIYAFGIVVLEMMLRDDPYVEQSWVNIAQGKHAAIPEETPVVLAKIIAGCLNRDPSKRLDTQGISELLENKVTCLKPTDTITELCASMRSSIERGNLKAVQILIALNDTLLNQPNLQGFTPLHLAVYFKEIEIVRYLIGVGAELNRVTPKADDDSDDYLYPNMTALDIILHTRKDDGIAILLLDAGARILPAHILFAAKNGRLDPIKKLLAVDPALMHVRDAMNQTALLWAAAKGHTEMVSYLIAQGADVNVATQHQNHAESDHNNSALDWAIKGGHTAIIEMLTTAGAIANKRVAAANIEPASVKNSHRLFNGFNQAKTAGFSASFVPELMTLPVFTSLERERTSLIS